MNKIEAIPDPRLPFHLDQWASTSPHPARVASSRVSDLQSAQAGEGMTSCTIFFPGHSISSLRGLLQEIPHPSLAYSVGDFRQGGRLTKAAWLHSRTIGSEE